MVSNPVSAVLKSTLSALPWRGALVVSGILLFVWILFKLWMFFRDVGR